MTFARHSRIQYPLGDSGRLRQNDDVNDLRIPPAPDLPVISDAERNASLERMLAGWNGSDPIWVFAYGSLIWNPDLEYDAKHCAIVHGFHRRLCMWSRVYRGTPSHPGLVLALDRGGSCQGVAYRLPADVVRPELTKLWKRELVTGAYEPRWLGTRACGPCASESPAAGPRASKALGFVVRRNTDGYAGRLDHPTLLTTLRSARGTNGSSADYLFATVEGLAAHGLEDHALATLADEVAAGLF